uniref:Uncharacterized protein n=1 Tax=Setaria viridis TaxID=4556 RepID=A0A4U6VAD3_SETVI|nr:hypothetical protein SEVIR_4G118902v2 [Setaria viridis]
MSIGGAERRGCRRDWIPRWWRPRALEERREGAAAVTGSYSDGIREHRWRGGDSSGLPSAGGGGEAPSVRRLRACDADQMPKATGSTGGQADTVTVAAGRKGTDARRTASFSDNPRMGTKHKLDAIVPAPSPRRTTRAS